MAKIAEGSTWDAGVSFPQFPRLTERLEVDVAVVGAGLTGVTAAYLLSQAGYAVALIEKDRIGQGATAMTTAFLTQYVDTNIADLIAMFGAEKATAVLRSHAQAIDIVERIVADEHIDCEFMRCPNYIYATSAQENKELQNEEEAARGLGITLTFKSDGTLPFQQSGYLELMNQAKFHPLKYVAALVRILAARGVTIYEETEALTIEPGTPAVVKSAEQEVSANHVMVTTYAPFDGQLHFKKAWYSSYIVEAAIGPGLLPEAIYEDTDNPYHYFRVDHMEDKDRLILGGADHRSDVPVEAEKNFQALTDYLHSLLTDVPHEITRRWRGPIIEPVDGLAFIGPLEHDNIWYATGFSGNGMTYATIAAQLITDLIQDKTNAWLSLYDARRTPTLKQLAHKGYDYGEEFIGGAVKNTLRRRS